MCNLDCFHCQYDDCIRDERQDQRDHDRAYYNENREKINAYRKERYHKNIEQFREYHREYQRNHYNREVNTEKCRIWREANKEKKRKYDRERYLKRKKVS